MKKLRESIVKCFFYRKQKLVLFSKYKKNDKKTDESILRREILVTNDNN
jgi:hypothetical protein